VDALWILSAPKVKLVRVVGIEPNRVVGICPDLVVGICPDLVVGICPDLADAVADTSRSNMTVQVIDLTFFIFMLLLP
jgi:hypothetical protein